MTTTVVALGGNALLKRGEPMDPAVQDRNIEHAANVLGTTMRPDDQLVITHGNGPQVGLLSLTDSARRDGPPPVYPTALE